MTTLEFRLARLVLRTVAVLVGWLPISPRRIVLATARHEHLEGNLAYLDAAIRHHEPTAEIVHLLQPYGYGLRAKARYLVRMARAMVELRRARLFIVDNAFLPVHVGPHRSGTTVVQVWHAASALKRFGLDAPGSLRPAERLYLHRHYDYVVASSDFAREPYAAAFGVPPERVVPTGIPRSDFFADPGAMARVRERLLDRFPEVRGRTVVLYAPTFRGRGRHRTATHALDGPSLRAALPPDHVLVLKAHPNLDPALTPTAGFDLVVGPDVGINELFTITDILVTDYSSSIFEWATLGRPLILFVPDLDTYRTSPGLYLDYATEMIGLQVRDTAAVAEGILKGRFDLEGYGSFVARHLGAADGGASRRFVETFVRTDPA